MAKTDSLALSRWSLFEFEDQPWFPRLIRRYMQDCMEYCGNLSPNFYKPFIPKLKQAMAATGQSQIVDLGSGGAGPIRTVIKLLRAGGDFPATALLTDLYPNLEAFEKVRRASGGAVDYVRDSVDATALPRGLGGFRFLSNSFHHFEPALARAILASAVRDGCGIAVLESVDRSLGNLVAMPIGVLMSLLFAPFIRPFSLKRLFFTYVIPAVPLFVLFDGISSCLRSYCVADLRKLTSGLGDDGSYTWEIGHLPIAGTPMRLTYLVGTPATT